MRRSSRRAAGDLRCVVDPEDPPSLSTTTLTCCCCCSSPPPVMAWKGGCGGRDGPKVPLEMLLRRDVTSEREEKPDVLHGQAGASKKGEDFTLLRTECQRVPGDGSTAFSVFAIFDGHNGSAAAIYTKENLLNSILRSIPPDLSRDDWIAALPRALVAGFVKTDKDFQEKARFSGTTVTIVIIDGWIVTVASVGDSCCVLESAEGSVYSLTADHRLEVNEEEVARITHSGGEVGRLMTAGGAEVGPLRCWPGGLCLSRSIGDMDAGEYIVPIPYVKQVKLSNAGGRIIISSDGVWDALTYEMALRCCRGLPAEAAAYHIVKEAIKIKGLRDDTTCIVIDILPPEKLGPLIPRPKKLGKNLFKSLFRRKSRHSSSLHDGGFCEANLVEEMFEDGSPILAHRLSVDYPKRDIFRLLVCAVCQLDMKPGEGTPVEGVSLHRHRLSPWDGPLLCKSCQAKKEAMEGKTTPC